MGISNTIQQLSVFLENREGRLDTVLKILAENDVNIVALSLADTSRTSCDWFTEQSDASDRGR